MLTSKITVSLPAVIVAVGVIIGWALANEYFHVVFSYCEGMVLMAGYKLGNTWFEIAVYVMGGTVFVAAAAIIIMGIKKK